MKLSFMIGKSLQLKFLLYRNLVIKNSRLFNFKRFFILEVGVELDLCRLEF